MFESNNRSIRFDRFGEQNRRRRRRPRLILSERVYVFFIYLFIYFFLFFFFLTKEESFTGRGKASPFPSTGDNESVVSSRSPHGYIAPP